METGPDPSNLSLDLDRVADPHSFHPDLDPHFRLNTSPDPDPGLY